MKGKEFVDWMPGKIHDLNILIGLLKVRAGEDFNGLVRVETLTDDPLQIKDVTDHIASGCNELLVWEIDLQAIKPPFNLFKLMNKMRGWGKSVFESIESIAPQIDQSFTNPEPSGTYTITFVLKKPNNMDECIAEVRRLKENPSEWMT
jgi:hypothetical protein